MDKGGGLRLGLGRRGRVTAVVLPVDGDDLGATLGAGPPHAVGRRHHARRRVRVREGDEALGTYDLGGRGVAQVHGGDLGAGGAGHHLLGGVSRRFQWRSGAGGGILGVAQTRGAEDREPGAGAAEIADGRWGDGQAGAGADRDAHVVIAGVAVVAGDDVTGL